MSVSIVDNTQDMLEGHCDWLVSKECTIMGKEYQYFPVLFIGNEEHHLGHR